MSSFAEHGPCRALVGLKGERKTLTKPEMPTDRTGYPKMPFWLMPQARRRTTCGMIRSCGLQDFVADSSSPPHELRNNANFLLLLLSMATRIVVFGSSNKDFGNRRGRRLQAARQQLVFVCSGIIRLGDFTVPWGI
jgi:hypothetical protein